MYAAPSLIRTSSASGDSVSPSIDMRSASRASARSCGRGSPLGAISATSEAAIESESEMAPGVTLTSSELKPGS